MTVFEYDPREGTVNSIAEVADIITELDDEGRLEDDDYKALAMLNNISLAVATGEVVGSDIVSSLADMGWRTE